MANRDLVRIRAPVPGDRAAVIALIAALRRLHGDPTPDRVAQATWGDVWADGSLLRLIVADLGEGPVGYALSHDAYEPGHAAHGVYMCDLFVDPAQRRRGIGRRLILAVAADARRRGRIFVWWVSQDWNDEARAFYRALGASDHAVHAHALIRP